MRDFTLQALKKLLSDIAKSKYKIITFEDYIQNKGSKEKNIILRHDVDKKPLRALRTAEMENELGIKGTYYFRVEKNKLPKEVIERVTKLGHEIGYHYDDLNAAKGVVETALKLFQNNLARLRQSAVVKTACMHGSPLSRHDNRELWKTHSYREFGIIGEPYFDIDFNEVMYLTDTGRRWDGEKVSIRDKVIGDGLWVRGKSEEEIGDRQWVMGDGEDRRQKTENKGQKEKDSRGVVFDPPVLLHSTLDIINALTNNRLPNKIMLTVHPQRWSDQWLPWIWELGWQNVKNGVKYFVLRGSS
jgi:hypothetical protein